MLMDRIADEFRLPKNVVEMIIATAPYRYKVYKVKKKSGAGERVIAQPAKEVKALQRYLVNDILNQLPLHEAATAYRKGSSIRHNAEKHVNNNFLLKMDFTDFFPSLRPDDLKQHISIHMADAFYSSDL